MGVGIFAVLLVLPSGKTNEMSNPIGMAPVIPLRDHASNPE